MRIKTTDWLLDNRNQGVRYFALINVFNEPPDSMAVTSCLDGIYKTRPVAEILAAQTDRGRWGTSGRTLYTRYTGTFWQVYFLTELGAARHPQTRKGAEYLLARGQTDSGAFSPSGDEKSAEPGLTAITLRAMLACGMHGEKVEKTVQYLISVFRKHKGYPSPARVHELDPMSRAALPKVILAMTSVPDWKKRADVSALVKDIAEEILSRKIFHIYPKRNAEWIKEVRKWEPRNIEVARKSFLEEFPDALERVPDEDWLELGFPNSDVSSDILENLRALAAAGIPDCEALHPALDIIEKNRSHNRTWNLDRTLEPVISKVEKPGEPSKWITLYALEVLKSFGRWLPPTRI